MEDLEDEVGRAAPDGSRTPTRRTVAWVDVAHLRSVAPAIAGTVLERLRQAVRDDDRICPMAVTRLAVAFGPSVAGVPPRVLAGRLARAIDGAGHGAEVPLPVAVSIGVDRTDPGAGAADPARRAGSAAAWEAIEQHWDEMLLRWPQNTMHRVLEQLPALVAAGDDAVQRASAWLDSHPVTRGELKVRQSRERLHVNQVFKARVAGQLRAALTARAPGAP